MAAKGFILAGLGLLAFFGFLQTPRALAHGLRYYLEKMFPGATARVHIGAGPFWFLTGNIDDVNIDLAHFSATQFPIPTNGSADLTGDVPAQAAGSPGAAGSSVSEAEQAGGVFDVHSSSENVNRISDAPSETTVPRNESADTGTEPGPRSAGAGHEDHKKPGHRTRWAHIGNIKVTLKDFSFFGRSLRELRVELPDVRYDFGLARSRRLLRLGGSRPGTLLIRLSSEDLTQATVIDRADIRSLLIHTEDGRVRVTLDYRTPLGWAPVSVSGQLELVQDHAIYFTHPTISAANISLPQAMTDFILKRVENLNPVFDLDRLALPMNVALTDVTSTETGLVVRGTVRIPVDDGGRRTKDGRKG
ncbi:MAG TPA: DUF2993 domain-containing protein [Armatimonadota bacterium]|nr:DUF2993 domain-containing protein [Armatimonadota bacterium]